MLRFIKSMFSSVTEPEEIVVNIEELSQIWLKYNTSFEISELRSESKPELQTVSEGEAPKVSPPGEKPPLESPPGEKDFFIQKVLTEFYEPYRVLLESHGAKEGFLGILKLLDEHGNCPSIVAGGNDTEADEVTVKVREILEKVSLREHSTNVARILLRLIKENYRDHENLIPRALVVAFGHDLGKIPVLRKSGIYAKADHPIISAQKLQELFAGGEPVWFQEALQVIRDHHRKTKDNFAILLKRADSRAREMEINQYSKDFKVVEWSKWFDVPEYLKLIAPEINLIQTGNRWKAFSFGSVVYCQPDFLYDRAKKLASEKKVLDLSLMQDSEKESVLIKIVNSLRKGGVLVPEVGEGYFGRKYEIQGDKLQKKMYLVPIKIEAFGVPHEIEKRKEGYLETIKGVVPE